MDKLNKQKPFNSSPKDECWDWDETVHNSMFSPLQYDVSITILYKTQAIKDYDVGITKWETSQEIIEYEYENLRYKTDY